MTRGSAISIDAIVAAANGDALRLCRKFMPNGARDGDKYVASNIWDSGKGRSLIVDLKGRYAGNWTDFGNSGAGEDQGDMIDLVRIRLCAGDKGAAIRWIKAEYGLSDDNPNDHARASLPPPRDTDADEAAAAEERGRRVSHAQRMWLSGKVIAGTPAEAYLAGRNLAGEAPWPGSLHYHAEIWNRQAALKMPCMLACMMRPDGSYAATHRTWLGRHPDDRRWVKAEDAETGVTRGDSKKVIGPCAGAFIPINKGSSGKSMLAMPEGEPIYATEGIEDALVVRLARPQFRIIAGYSLSNLGGLRPPPQAGPLRLVIDRDDNPAALGQLERTLARLQAAGVAVEIVMPPAGVKDLNDWLRGADARTLRGMAA